MLDKIIRFSCYLCAISNAISLMAVYFAGFTLDAKQVAAAALTGSMLGFLNFGRNL